MKKMKEAMLWLPALPELWVRWLFDFVALLYDKVVKEKSRKLLSSYEVV